MMLVLVTMKNVMKPALWALGALAVCSTALAEGDAAAGESKAAPCAACHGADGNSPAAIYPSLAGLGGKYLLKQMQEINTGDREVPEMAGQLDSLSEQDLEDIAAYYAGQEMSLTGAEELTVTVNSGDQVDGLVLGEALYRFGNADSGVPACSGCHSPTGQGNAPAAYPHLGGQHADYIAKQLQAFRAGERTNDGETQVMRSVAQYLSDAEIAAVANYIAGLH